MLFELEISDKPIIDSSFNQCLWQLKKESRGIMGKFTELLTNSDNWSSSRCTMEWKAEYVKKNRFIFFLHTNHSEYLLRTPTCEGDAPQKEFVDWIRQTSPKELAAKTKLPFTKVEHWFRTKKMGFSHPSIEDWNIIKAHLKDWQKWEFQMTFQQNLQWKGMLPTPKARDWKGEGFNTDLPTMFIKGSNQKHGITFQLNPQFVLEMMGFPIDFTEKPFNNVI